MKLYQSADLLQKQCLWKNKNWCFSAILQICFIVFWVYTLLGTDSYYSVYLLCAFAGVICTVQNSRSSNRFDLKTSGILLCFAVWFASTTVLANYGLFIVRPVLERCVCAVGALLGGTTAGYHVISFIAVRVPFSIQRRKDERSASRVFFLSFCLMEGIYLVYLLGAAYPGYFTPDVFNSIDQIIKGVYVNNNPFWYTMSIKAIAGLGYGIFGTTNAALAFYVFCQGLFMAAVFSYVLVTLYQIGIPTKIVAAIGTVYGLLPYHIAYSATMLKDIPFSVSCLLFVVSLYRIIRDVGKKQSLNYLFFAFGAFIFCLMRTNGLASFFVTMLVVLLLLRKSRKRVLVILVVMILVLSWILTNPVLEKWNVGSTDFVEGLAVPFQQIARVITMGYELDPYEYEMLNKVFDVELIPEVFQHECVDPIKRAAFREDGRVYLRENLNAYVKLWVQMAKEHPGEYVKAWIELTKGYWNSGYQYWIYFIGGENPAIGLVRPETLPLKGFFEGYFKLVESMVIFQPLYSIGFHVWLLFACLALNVKQKRMELVLAIPGIIIILGLWLGTPVFSEFRYAYPMILSMPLIIGTTLYHKN